MAVGGGRKRKDAKSASVNSFGEGTCLLHTPSARHHRLFFYFWRSIRARKMRANRLFSSAFCFYFGRLRTLIISADT